MRGPITIAGLVATLALVSGCHRPSSLETASADLDASDPGGDGAKAPRPTQAAPPPAQSEPAPTAASPAPKADPAPAPAPPPASTNTGHESADISRSPGQPGGVVVLWPRIIPRGSVSSDLARQVQDHVVQVVRNALPGKPIDVRPEPERTCRRAGCDAVAVSVLLSAHNNGCVAVGVVTPPGPVETTLVEWGGRVNLRATQIPFRAPPESHMSVADFASCNDLLGAMKAGDDAMARAIRAATP